MIAIIEAVICQERNLEAETLHCKNRYKEVREPRQIIMYLAREYTKLSMREVGEYFEQDHSTVHHACKTVNNHIDTEPKFKKRILNYKDQLENFNGMKIAESVKFEFDTELAIEKIKISISNLKKQIIEKEVALYQLEQKLKNQ